MVNPNQESAQAMGNNGITQNPATLSPGFTQGGAYVLLTAGDVVVSNDSVTAPMWSDNNPTLTTFYSSSTQVSSNVQEYYTSIFQTASTVTSSYWYAMPIERARYKQTILPGTWTMYLSGSNATTWTSADPVTSDITLVAPFPVTNTPGTVTVTQGFVTWYEDEWDLTSTGIDTTFQAYWDALTGPAPTIEVIITADNVTSIEFSAAFGDNTDPLKVGMVVKLGLGMVGITEPWRSNAEL